MPFSSCYCRVFEISKKLRSKQLLSKMHTKPVLYGDIRSPPVRSVLLLVDELKIDIEFKKINLFKQEHLTPEYLKVKILLTMLFLV